MNDNLSNFQGFDEPLDAGALSTSRSFIANVFSFMALAMIISGIASFWFASSGMVFNLIGDSGLNLLGWIVMLAPLGMVLVMNFAFNRLSYTALVALFIAYATVTGISLSFIFLVYALATIGKVFFITSALFGTMAVLGYTTKTDLTKMGSILGMALIGIIIASLVNMFMKSPAFDYIISCIGVLVFTGLTAYDVQKIKRIGAGVEYGTAASSKLSIMGALTLYLDFINLFLFLLRVFGGRRD
jgi:FtsH-binding integral membrane protein